MQIGSDDASLHASLPAVGAVVALADQDFAERFGVPAEERPSTVVFKTHQRAGREVLQVGLDDNVADEALLPSLGPDVDQDRKSTRLNSSHITISYAVFCL